MGGGVDVNARLTASMAHCFLIPHPLDAMINFVLSAAAMSHAHEKQNLETLSIQAKEWKLTI